MKIRQVKPFDIPPHLIAQKKTWDVSVFYQLATVAEAWFAYVVSDGDTDIAALILYDDPLYDAIGAQTLIIDKSVRTPELVEKMFQLSRRIMLEKAKHLGRRYITANLRTPEKYIAMVGNPEGLRVIESTVREEVGR